MKFWGFGARAAPPKQKALSGGGRAFDAGRMDTAETVNWLPTNNDPNDEILDSREKVVARARDLGRNHPVIAGAIDRRAESVVGAKIRLEAQPSFEALGLDAEWADEWSTTTEAKFTVWGQDYRFLCDAHMQSTFGGMVETAYRHWWVDGDALAVIKMLPRGGKYQTAIELIDPDRLTNPDGVADNTLLSNGNKIVQGVELDRNGAAVAFHFRVTHPASTGFDTDTFRWERIARFGKTGRPQVVHAYKRQRAAQRRGISRIVASIQRIKQFDRYDKAEIEAALLNAVMAAVVESPLPTADVAPALAPADEEADGSSWSYAAQFAYRLKNKIKGVGTRITHLLPGEKLTFQRAERPSQNYPEFQATGLRSIAANFGLSYAQLSQNWADINYSSARTMLNEIWRGLIHDRWMFTQSFCTPIYAAWLEEAVAIGEVKVPGRAMNFYKWRPELCMCEWMGPGRGSIDPLKEATANEFELNAGTTNLSMIADSNGTDHRIVLLGQARDKRLREKLGLDEYKPLKGKPDPEAAAAQPGAGQEPQNEERQSA